MEYEIDKLTTTLEDRINSSIKGVSSHDWDEDYITRKLLSDLKKSISTINLVGKDLRSKINWETYKLRGSHETNYGDIALVVNINFKDATDIEGVAFLEAKKRDWRKTTFSAMNKRQRQRILKNAPRAQYLLYDYEDITNFINPLGFNNELLHYKSRWLMSLTERTSAVCVPLNLADATGFKDTFIYRYGTPLSIMFTHRYFQGLDLEFGDTAKSIAKGFLTKFGLSKYVMTITISESGSEPDDRQLNLNLDKFMKLDKDNN